MVEIVKICGLGLLGYLFPRILVGAGVPLDEWGKYIGSKIVGMGVVISGGTALNILGVFFAILLIAIELWWKPVGRIIKKMQSKKQITTQKAEQPLADMPIREAIEHIRAVIGDNDFDKSCYLETRIAIRQAALDGKISIYGKRELEPPAQIDSCSEVYAKVDSDYWADHEINSMAVGELWENYDHTNSENRNMNEYKNRYWNLRVNSQEIKDAWPLENT